MRFIPHASSSAGNLYEVRSGETRILLDAGLTAREIRRRVWTLSDVAGLLLSHEHGDHARGARELLACGVPTYCSQGTAEALGLRAPWLHIVRCGRQVRVGGVSVIPLAVQHDATEPLAYVLDGDERLLWVMDTGRFPWAVPGCAVLAVECNHHDLSDVPQERRRRLLDHHMGLSGVVDLVQALASPALREVHLLHLSREHADPAECCRAVEQIAGCAVTAEEP